jgi:hypothetical protein
MSARDDQIIQNAQALHMIDLRFLQGCAVYDILGAPLGIIHAVHVAERYFVLQTRGIFAQDYCVPLSAIWRMAPATVYVRVSEEQLKTQGWAQPSIR